MVVSPLPQPFPQRGVGVGRCLAAWPVTLGAAVLSDDPQANRSLTFITAMR